MVQANIKILTKNKKRPGFPGRFCIFKYSPRVFLTYDR